MSILGNLDEGRKVTRFLTTSILSFLDGMQAFDFNSNTENIALLA